MPWGAAIAAGGSILGGVLGASGQNTQVAQQQRMLDYLRQLYSQSREDLGPYRAFGERQLGGLETWLNNPNKRPSSYLDPGYEFRRTEGMKGVTGNAATAGLLQSGDTLRGVEQYGQNLASSEYGNAFNRWLQEGQFRQGLAGVGLTASSAGGQLGNQNAGIAGNLSSNTNFGGPDQVWGNVAAGLGGGIGNMVARRFAQQQQQPQDLTPGGANVFGPPNRY